MQQRRAYIDSQKCSQAPSCAAREHCPTKAITREGRDEPWYVGPECRGCGKCLLHCQRQAIRLI
ncbi:MAG: hypothetical protein PWP65_148 [Clostridia bacterium]|nr:hypothetical protein [Clostridia bacterium]